MGGLRALPAHLSMVGSFAWPAALGGMGSGHLLLLSVPSLQSPKHQWLEGCPTWGRARGRLLVKFSVWGGAAAHGPPATTLPLGPCCQEAGQAGSAWGWALINRCSCLGARGAVQRAGRPEWQRSGSGVDRCEVRSQLPGLLLSPLRPAGARLPSGHSPARGPADPLMPACPACGQLAATPGQALWRWGPEDLSLLASHSPHQSGASGKQSLGHPVCHVVLPQGQPQVGLVKGQSSRGVQGPSANTPAQGLGPQGQP